MAPPSPPLGFIKPSKPPQPITPDKHTSNTANLHRAMHPYLTTTQINPNIVTQALKDLELTARERAQIREEKRKLLARQRADKVVLLAPVPRDEWPTRASSTRPRRSSATSRPRDVPGRDRRATVAGVTGDGNGGEEFSIWAKTLRKDSRASPAARRDTIGSVPDASLHGYHEDVSPYGLDPDLEAARAHISRRVKENMNTSYGTLTYFPAPVLNEARRLEQERADREVGLHLLAFVVIGMVLFLGVGWVVLMAEWDAVESGEEGVREGWVSLVGAML